MATEIGRLITIFEADISKFEAARKQHDAGMQKSAQVANQAQRQIGQGELTLAQQRRASDALQRQRSAALIRQYNDQQRAAQRAAAGTRPFSQVLSELSTSVATLQGPLGGISGRLSSLGSLFTAATGPIGLMVAGFGALAAGAVTAAAAIYKLAASTAEATGHFKDLAQQTGFSVETLSTLANVAETSGGSIDTITASLGIFQRNMTEAQDSTTEMSRLFKQLSLDTKDNEKALRQALAELRKLPEGATQTALAMRLFGRSGREILAVSKELTGTLDETTESMRGTSLTTTEMAEKGDELSDAIRRMSQVFGHAANVVGQEFGPDVKNAVESVTKAIIDNKEVIGLWGGAFAEATGKIYSTVSAIATLIGNLRTLDGMPISTLLTVLGAVRVGGTETANVPDMVSQFANSRSTFRTPNFSGFRPDQLGAPKGSGRGGAGRGTADPGIQLLKQLEDQFKNLTPRTQLQRVQEQLLSEEYSKTNPKIAEKIRLFARLIDVAKNTSDVMTEIREAEEKLARVTREVSDVMRAQGISITEQRQGLPDWIRDVNEFVRAKEEEGFVWAADTKQIYLNNAALLEQFRILSQGATRLRTVGGGFEKGGMGLDDSFAGGGGKRDRAAELRAQYESHVERMRDLAIDLTSTLDRAIFDGFEGGLKRGFQSLTLSALDLVKNVFLRQLENAIASALSGIGGGGGKGGILQSIIGFGLSALGGIGGGFGKGGISGGFAGKFGAGGNIPMGQWGVVHDNEKVLATPYGAKVIPSGDGGGNTVINIHVPVRSAGSYSSPKSRRQIAEDVAAALQGALG